MNILQAEKSILPNIIASFLLGIVVGGFMLWMLIQNNVFVTQNMALTTLKERCLPGEAWEYTVPNPDTGGALFTVQCNPQP